MGGLIILMVDGRLSDLGRGLMSLPLKEHTGTKPPKFTGSCNWASLKFNDDKSIGISVSYRWTIKSREVMMYYNISM